MNIPIRHSFVRNGFGLKHQTPVVSKPVKSPDLSPADFLHLPKFKTSPNGGIFQSIEEIMEKSL